MNIKDYTHGADLLNTACNAVLDCIEFQNETNFLPPPLREKLKAANKHIFTVYQRLMEDIVKYQKEEQKKKEEERQKKLEEFRRQQAEKRKTEEEKRNDEKWKALFAEMRKARRERERRKWEESKIHIHYIPSCLIHAFNNMPESLDEDSFNSFKA